MIDWALIAYSWFLLVVGGAQGLTVGSAGRVSCFSVVSELIDPSLNSRRHSTTWRKSCRPSKPSLQMPSSSERHRQPSCCRQPQAGSRRFDISGSRYPEPGRTMAALGQRSWPFQPRMRGQRKRRRQPSPGGFSSWCSPICCASDIERGANRVGRRRFLRKRVCFRRAH